MTHIRRFWLAFAVTVPIFVAAYAGVAVTQLGAATGLTVMTARYATTQERAAGKRKRKILYVSGSSGFYGVRCKQLSALIDRPAVNFGLHAGLGLRYLFDRALAFAAPGDVIIVGPEWELFAGPRFGEYACDYLMAQRPEYLQTLPWMAAFQIFVSAGPERIFTGFWSALAGGKTKPEVPRPESINDHGDRILTATDEARARIGPVQRGRTLPVWKEPSPEVREDVLAFARACRERGVAVVVVFPPLCLSDEANGNAADVLTAEAVAFWRTCGIPVLGTVQEAAYRPADAFDTNYHLRETAALTHTAKLAALLNGSQMLPERIMDTDVPRNYTWSAIVWPMGGL
jgi:hypothetical protein